jgi:glutaredoxin
MVCEVRRVTLYTRKGCHLCDQARDAILELRRSGHPLELREIDIESDPELERDYLERIPVVAVNGEVVSELHLDESALVAQLDTVGG